MSNTKILQLFLQALLLLFCLPLRGLCAETDTLASMSSIKDPDSLVSRDGVFKLGFFSPENTTNRYLGVLYTVSEQTVIWVANRDKPLANSSGSVTIARDGNLVLLNGENETVWSTNVTATSKSTKAQIQHTGNLVLRDMSTEKVVWESFKHPSHVFVPGMRIIENIRTGSRVIVSSWKNRTDPEVGTYTAGLRALNIPEIFIWHNDRPHWRSGPWNGQILIGMEVMYSPYLDGFRVVNDSAGTYYFTASEGKFLMKIGLNSTGSLEQTLWDDHKKSWDVTAAVPENDCGVYGKCGPFSTCNVHDSPICSCLKGFVPLNKEEWGRGNWTGGCVRRKLLQCNRSNGTGGSGDRFLRMQFMKVPAFPEQFPSRLEDECRGRCSRNCSCIAFAYDPNIGCMFWSKSLIDIQQFPGVGVDLHIRLATSELDNHKDKKLIIIIPVIVASVSASICVIIAWCCMAKKKGDKTKVKNAYEATETFQMDSNAIVLKDESEKVNIEELPLFTFETLANATNQFHEDSMLGRGGFGHVYLGKLANGREIAVKRLSAASGQGVDEFKTEVSVISKLQHRNLVTHT